MSKFRVGDYKTRDGREARVLMVVEGQRFPLIGVILGNDGVWRTTTWTDEGADLRAHASPDDLIPPRRTVWVNWYAGGTPNGRICCTTYATRELADDRATPERLACTEIEVPEELQ